MAGTLPSSGQISLGSIQEAHGGDSDTFMSEYYGADVGVPCSGRIKMSDFYGTASLDPLVKKVSGLDSPSKADGGYLIRRGGDWYTGDFPIDIIPGLEVRTHGGSGSGDLIIGNQAIEISMYGYIDHDFRVYMTTKDNPTGSHRLFHPDWTQIAACSHHSGGAGNVSCNATYNIDFTSGKRIRFAYSAGPNWQNVIQNAWIQITFPNPKPTIC